MLLTSLMVLQLCFDVAVAALLVGVLTRRRASAAPSAPSAPPAWYEESIRLVQELVIAADPMLEAMEGRRADAIVDGAVATPRDRHRRALALLRAGAYSEDTARRDGILPAELGVLRSVAAAVPRAPSSR